MTIIDNSYSNIKLNAVEKHSINPSVNINTLKFLFSYEINSQRCLSNISDIKSLLLVLEKRDILTPLNIAPFYCIYKELELNKHILHKHDELLKHNRDCLSQLKYGKLFH